MKELNLSQKHLIEGIKWISLMSSSDRWDLTAEEVAKLMGICNADAFLDLRVKAENNHLLSISEPTIERLSLLLAIWKGLQLITPTNRLDLAYSWFKTPNSNSLFGGKSIKEHLLESEDINSFYDVKRYLTANS